MALIDSSVSSEHPVTLIEISDEARPASAALNDSSVSAGLSERSSKFSGVPDSGSSAFLSDAIRTLPWRTKPKTGRAKLKTKTGLSCIDSSSSSS